MKCDGPTGWLLGALSKNCFRWLRRRGEKEERARNVCPGQVFGSPGAHPVFGWQSGGCRRKVLTCEDWSADTVKRYVAVARKLESQPQLVQTILQLEFELGRDSALDGITALRSLVGLNLEETDAVFVVTWLIFSAELDFNPCAENVKTLILIRASTSISGCCAVSLCRWTSWGWSKDVDSAEKGPWFQWDIARVTLT